MDSESELLSEVEKPTFPRNKLKRLKNRVASPDIQSITPSETSIEMDVFIAKNRKPGKAGKSSDEDPSTARTSDDLETEISEDLSLQTSGKSYRDKLKQRFQNIKQKSSQNLEKSILRKFKSRGENLDNLNKHIESLRNDNQSISLQLRAHQPYVYQGVGGEVSSTEKYQFFCDTTTGENEKPTENMEIEGLLEFIKPENFTALLGKSYEEIVWLPAKHNLNNSTENLEEHPENAKNEVKHPVIPKRHLHLLKQRLLASNNSEFFTTSGEIIYNKTNHTKETYRPEGYNTENPYKTLYKKPLIKQNTEITSIKIQQIHPILEINLQNLRFTKHPLFTQEHNLQEELIHLLNTHKTYENREKLIKTLQNLRNEKSAQIVQQNVSEDKNYINDNLVKKIKQTREDLYETSRLYRENARKILETWKNLKQHRVNHGHSNTTIKLVIKKTQLDFVENPEEILEEIRLENEVDYREKLKVYKEKLQEWKSSQNNEIEAEKPIKPPRISSSKKINTKIEEILSQSFGNFHEPILTFSLDYSNEITEVNITEEEKNRRKSVENTNIRLKLSLGKLLICKTKTYKLTTNFTLKIDEIFSIDLTYPEEDQQIDLEILQVKKTSKDVLLSKVKLPIPKLTEIQGATNFQELYFTSQDFPNKNLKISGFLSLCIGWLRRKPLDSVTTQSSVDRITHSAIYEAPKNLISKPEFQLDPFLATFTVFTRDDILSNVRFKLLELRDRNEPEFVGMIVPLRIKEIPSNIFTTYERRLAEEKCDFFERADVDDIIGMRSLGRKVLRQMHTKVFQICRNCENNLNFDDVVDEKMVPWIQNYLKTILKNCLNWFKFQPSLTIPLPLLKLQTEIAETSGLNVNTHLNTKVKLQIHLKSGINLPTKDKTENKTKGYFIDISFGRNRLKSGLSHGKTQATWNENLQLDIDAQNLDYLNPQSLSGSILFKLFQINTNDIENPEEAQDDDEHFGNFTNYLGYFEIPIATALSDVKVEGEFPIEIPPFIYGYDKEEDRQGQSTPRVSQRGLSYVEMSVASGTTVPKIHADLTSIVSSEPPFLRDHILQWNHRFNIDHPKRKFNALAIDHHGKTVCLTRYMRPLEPPKLNNDEFDVSMDQCARFVSLIPFSKANKFYENVWITGEQLLKLGIGTIQDHATLLTNYLLSLKLDVWLLLGFGIPYGNTAYVLIREYNETPLPDHYILDVVTCVRYNITDQYCPLKKIYCVVNEHNIWANTQRGDAVFTTRFDFTRKFDWQPLFNETISAPTNTQQHNLHYHQIPAKNLQKLQQTIERKIHKKIATLRDQDVTIWSHYFNKLLHEQIIKAERNFMLGKTTLPTTTTIQEYSKKYKIHGTTQCLSFSSVNWIVDKVLQTEIWQITHKGEEFACCVQVNAYVNHVIAVWVAFVSIVKCLE